MQPISPPGVNVAYMQNPSPYPYGPPQGMQGMPQGMYYPVLTGPQGMPHGMPHGMPQGMPQGMQGMQYYPIPAHQMQQMQMYSPNQQQPGMAPNTNLFYKTRMCNKWRNGSCPFGEKCTYAHGQHELRRVSPEVLMQQQMLGGGYVMMLRGRVVVVSVLTCDNTLCPWMSREYTVILRECLVCDCYYL